ncbi:MAG TPA: aminotransferase class III-fold pyridoxal phosphate-dependent enzyme, partial [Chitinophagales bacterium]|nr:aminotransferase class III-fold pyridoxal phosphate-dependent enzyme [Chitinophagales bacterium]
MAPTSDAPLMLEVERADGIYMFGPGGKRYTDLISGIGVSHLGHRHPKVVEAICKQASEHYLHLMVYGEYVQTPQALLAEKLTS